jgi:hypothetical protein
LFAPNTRAALSTDGEICSTNGTMISTTSGSVGTRLTSTTAVMVPPRPIRYMSAASCTA